MFSKIVYHILFFFTLQLRCSSCSMAMQLYFNFSVRLDLYYPILILVCLKWMMILADHIHLQPKMKASLTCIVSISQQDSKFKSINKKIIPHIEFLKPMVMFKV